MLWAAKVDANQAEIVEALRAVGADVALSHRLGGGFPDLVVGFRNGCFMLEIKTAKGKLTPAERKFMEGWRGHYAIVRTPEEALRAIGVLE